MKIAICSDLHLEFGSLSLENTESAGVLILSGDILVESDLDEWNETQAANGFSRRRSVAYHKFFQECAKQFPLVLYVAGNHEHYHGDFSTTVSNLKNKLAYLDNVQVLECDTFRYQGYVFVGCTLWTDMNQADPLTLYHIKSAMSDFRIISNSNNKTYRRVPLYARDENGAYIKGTDGAKIQDGIKMKEEISTFSPQDAVNEFHKSTQYINTVYTNLAPTETMVVVGHHAPSRASTHPRYVHETLMNGGYSSELSEFILDRPRIKLWTHGHTHEDFDYTIGSCRVVCNPRGYIGHEQRADNFTLKVVEL